MGLPALSLEELAHLPKAKMFGVDGIVVDWRGTFTDTMNNRKVEKARFLGAIAITDSRAIFVKLSGPETEIDDKVRDGFMDLCGSLKE